jgi:hypothetical protein
MGEDQAAARINNLSPDKQIKVLFNQVSPDSPFKQAASPRRFESGKAGGR